MWLSSSDEVEETNFQNQIKKKKKISRYTFSLKIYCDENQEKMCKLHNKFVKYFFSLFFKKRFSLGSRLNTVTKETQKSVQLNC